MMITVVIQIQSISRVHSSVAAKSNKSPKYIIPLRAVLFSAILFLSVLAGIATMRMLKMNMGTSATIGTLIVVAINAFRCPLMTALTFSAKVKTDQESRAKRQERVRAWARKEREEHKQKIQSNIVV